MTRFGSLLLGSLSFASTIPANPVCNKAIVLIVEISDPCVQLDDVCGCYWPDHI